MPFEQVQLSIADLAPRYSKTPSDKMLGLNYGNALRAANQNAQALTVFETLLTHHKSDKDVSLAYAKALTEAGRFDQALNILNNSIDPLAPNWDALIVRGTIYDQQSNHALARADYNQAALLAPNESRIYTNLGLSHSMTGELKEAEAYLRKAVSLPGANSKTRQNLALVIGLQGKFAESQKLYAAELPASEIDSNMQYIRTIVAQPNKWAAIRNAN